MREGGRDFRERISPVFLMYGIKKAEKFQIIDMKKIKDNPLEKTREERESCFPEGNPERMRERVR